MNLQISHADLTFAGAMKMAAQQTLPFWWDDASDFSVLEAYAVSSYNNVSVNYYLTIVQALLAVLCRLKILEFKIWFLVVQKTFWETLTFSGNILTMLLSNYHYIVKQTNS